MDLQLVSAIFSKLVAITAKGLKNDPTKLNKISCSNEETLRYTHDSYHRKFFSARIVFVPFDHPNNFWKLRIITVFVGLAEPGSQSLPNMSVGISFLKEFARW